MASDDDNAVDPLRGCVVVHSGDCLRNLVGRRPDVRPRRNGAGGTSWRGPSYRPISESVGVRLPLPPGGDVTA